MPDYVGHRVSRWRDVAGLTQQELADRVGVTRPYISMIESGKVAVTKRARLISLAEGLGVSVTDLTGQPNQPRSRDDWAAYIAVPAIRQALEGPDEQPEPRSIAHLADLADWAMGARMAGDWTALGSILPGLIAETGALADAGDDRAAALHIKACVTASLALKPLGFLDLAHRVADRAAQYASALADPVHAAAASFTQAQAALAAGSRKTSLARSERAIDKIGDGDEHSRTWLGMLHLHAAMSAASLGLADQSDGHLQEAETLASVMRSDPWRMEFGPANVGVWRVGIALENGEPQRAPELARKVDQTKLRTIQRRARLHTDAARGHYLAGNRDGAIRLLLIADHMAPQEVRSRPSVQEIVGQMVRDVRNGSDQLRDLAMRMGIDPPER